MARKKTPAPDPFEGVDRFVGYGPASKYLGIAQNTLSSYCARGIGPQMYSVQADGQYNRPVFRRTDLDEWTKNRPGQGARTDLVQAN